MLLEVVLLSNTELFKPDIFHMGGDEVHNHCWNSSTEIKDWMLAKGWELDDKGFFQLWEYFQAKALQNVYRVIQILGLSH